MGLTYTDLRNLISWRGNSAGGRVVTIGRLNVTMLRPEVGRLRRELTDARAQAWLESYQWSDFADDMFREVLRFDSVSSIDFSDYEGADIITDIGNTLPPGLAGQFDLVVDGGTLEHVFNFPLAAGNLMRLAKTGGAVYMQNPCNGLSGHGFYQFSPELMYRIFSQQNGFAVKFVRVAVGNSLSIENSTSVKVYEAVDPATIGRRIMISGADPVVMMTMAVKTREVESLFESAVVQSDYAARWSEASPTASLNWKGKIVEAAGRLFPIIPRMAQRRLSSVRDRQAFTRIR
jgi:hypothetical protein